MKTKRIVNLISSIVLLCVFLVGFSVQNIYGQEEVKVKQVRIKVITDNDGVVTEIDTSFDMTDDLDIEKIISINDFDGELSDEIKEKLKEIELEMDIDFIEGDLKDSLIECHVITKLIESEDGEDHKVIIKKIDGDTKIMKDSQGVFITRPGSNKTVDIYIDDLEVDCTNIKDSIKVICIKTDKEEHEYKIVMDCIEDLDKDSLIRTMKVSMDGATIVIATKVMILDVEDEDLEELKNSNLKNTTAKMKSLDIENIDFYPNPSSGQFKLSFTLENKGDTEIKVYDMGGREVYNEKLKNFSGSYDKYIDISENANGTYFLHVSQGKAAVAKKIILQ